MVITEVPCVCWLTQSIGTSSPKYLTLVKSTHYQTPLREWTIRDFHQTQAAGLCRLGGRCGSRSRVPLVFQAIVVARASPLLFVQKRHCGPEIATHCRYRTRKDNPRAIYTTYCLPSLLFTSSWSSQNSSFILFSCFIIDEDIIVLYLNEEKHKLVHTIVLYLL
jgi:hypothetical protein